MKDKTERFQEAFEYLRAQGKVHTQIEAAAKMGATSQNFSAAMNGNLKLLTDKFLKRFNAAFDGVFNIKWLLTGEGEMLQGVPNKGVVPTEGNGVPFFKELPVSAGKAELMLIENAERAAGFINITGVSGMAAFPVIGCSMEPVIHAGDIVVVDDVDRWDRIDPDKIYLIFTHDDRMIKHLEMDENNNDILWCVSPNYKRFSIQKADICKIYRVTFYGRLA